MPSYSKIPDPTAPKQTNRVVPCQGYRTSLIMIVTVISTVMMNLLPNPQTSQNMRTTSNLPPRYNLHSKSINVTVLNVVAPTTNHHQLEINPDIIPPLVVKPIARLTKGYGRENELLQLSLWAWSRLAETDTFHANAIID